MSERINLKDISIRTELKPGDIGYIIHLHGDLYKKEYGYGIEFEVYVAEGLAEFFRKYNSEFDKVWICEHENKTTGFLLAEHRGDASQFRYFIVLPEYRGIGLGDKLMQLFTEHIKEKKYKSAYLWTTKELISAAYLYKKYGFQLTEEKESISFGKLAIEQRYDLQLS
jgi:N-acetylglutamate synthase-like GNAT family acetyltransferase